MSRDDAFTQELLAEDFLVTDRERRLREDLLEARGFVVGLQTGPVMKNDGHDYLLVAPGSLQHLIHLLDGKKPDLRVIGGV